MSLRELEERGIDFSYDYPMRCPACSAKTTVSAQDYYDQVNECRVRCSGCSDDLHFGPVVAAIRDAADPALTDAAVGQVAWYHSSTEPTWPPPERGPLEFGILAHHMPADAMARAVQRHADQALHVGTYEAAIESMLRRMRDQGDAASKFFLYRVALRADLAIEPGYRDENEEEAAQITQSQISAAGVQAIRYLNAWEASGSLSLAVCREAVEAVQVLPVPIESLGAPIPPDLINAVDAIVQRIAQFKVDPLQRRTPGTARRRTAQEIPLEYWNLKASIREHLAWALLQDVSPVVRDDVDHAMSCWEADHGPLSADALVGRWAAVAALLELPGQVIARLAREPVRSL